MVGFRGRLTAIVISAAIAIAALAVVVMAFVPRGKAPARQPTEQTMYAVTFPTDPIPVEGQAGHYTLVIETNLPDGTLVDTEYVDSLGEGGNCCYSVVKGQLQLPLVNNRCTDSDGVTQGSDVTVHIIAQPNFVFFGNQLSAQNPRAQPEDVFAILGKDFENLNGPDVTMKGDTRILIASQEYALPSDTCVSPFSSHSG